MLLIFYKTMALLASVSFSPLQNENAYLDPGSGSFLLQILLAALLGGLFVLRSYWGKLKSFITNLFSKEDTHEE